MADEPDNETTEQSEVPAAEAVEAQVAAAAEVQAAEAAATQAAEAAKAEAQAAEAAAAEVQAATPSIPIPPPEPVATGVARRPEADEPGPPSVNQLSPKERRRRKRAAHTDKARPRPQRTPQERHAERVAERQAKAVRRRARRLAERTKAAERRAAAPAPEPLAPVHAPREGTRKVRQGIVVSSKADKTITVRIDVARRHRRYEKIVRSSNTLHAHDENNEAHEGDVVRVIESRPLSRLKRWKLVDVVERAR
jgi:small subunit ribosomal protein S17